LQIYFAKIIGNVRAKGALFENVYFNESN